MKPGYTLEPLPGTCEIAPLAGQCSKTPKGNEIAAIQLQHTKKRFLRRSRLAQIDACPGPNDVRAGIVAVPADPGLQDLERPLRISRFPVCVSETRKHQAIRI
jgi:hypothetical protein